MNQKIGKLGSIAIFIIVLVYILIKRPFWGLMDDHLNVFEMIPVIEKEGLLRYAASYARNDLNWGMFRPTYPLLVYLLYAPAAASDPIVVFLLNALAVAGVLYLTALAFSKIVEVSRWTILLIYGCCFYLFDFFQHPSLQEKLVHLCGASLLLLLLQRRTALRILAIAGLIALGCMVKASFAIYLCMAVWIRFAEGSSMSLRQRIIRALPLAITLIISVVLFGLISKHGTYTQNGFKLGKILPNALSKDGLVLIFGSGAFALWAWLSRAWLGSPKVLTPLVGVSAFLTLFLPWSIAGYLHTMVDPIFAVLIAVLVERLTSGKLRTGVMGCFAILGLAIAFYRSDSMFGRLGDLRAFVSAAQGGQFSEVKHLNLNCLEGSDGMRRFLRSVGRDDIEVLYSPGIDKEAITNGAYYLYDRSFCPLPDISAYPGCKQVVLFEGTRQKSYKLVKLTCG